MKNSVIINFDFVRYLLIKIPVAFLTYFVYYKKTLILNS